MSVPGMTKAAKALRLRARLAGCDSVTHGDRPWANRPIHYLRFLTTANASIQLAISRLMLTMNGFTETNLDSALLGNKLTL